MHKKEIQRVAKYVASRIWLGPFSRGGCPLTNSTWIYTHTHAHAHQHAPQTPASYRMTIYDDTTTWRREWMAITACVCVWSVWIRWNHTQAYAHRAQKHTRTVYEIYGRLQCNLLDNVTVYNKFDQRRPSPGLFFGGPSAPRTEKNAVAARLVYARRLTTDWEKRLLCFSVGAQNNAI